MEAYLARAVVARVAGSGLSPKSNGEVEVAGLVEVVPKKPPPPKAGLAGPPKLKVEKAEAAGVPR